MALLKDDMQDCGVLTLKKKRSPGEKEEQKAKAWLMRESLEAGAAAGSGYHQREQVSRTGLLTAMGGEPQKGHVKQGTKTILPSQRLSWVEFNRFW